MSTTKRSCLLLLLLGLAFLAALPHPAAAQAPASADGRSAWRDVPGPAAGQFTELPVEPAISPMGDPLPAGYRLLALDRVALAGVLSLAPAETSAADVAAPLLLALPLPDGSFARFAVELSSVLEPQLAARHPQIQTYRGVGVDDPGASVRLGLTPSGFHALILDSSGGVYIAPYSRGPDPLYMSYYAASAVAQPFVCGAQEGMRPHPVEPASPVDLFSPTFSAGDDLRTYRLALASTGEFATDAAERAGLVNPTADQLRAAALDAVAARANLVNAIYEREVAIHLSLVDGNEQVIFVDAASDPYTNRDMGAMLVENQLTVDAVIGSANYDIGHVLGTAGGGVAYLGVTCDGSFKARGASGSGAAASAYAVMVTAHELGHQFNAEHTFNASSGPCGGGNRMASSAYEPGSGSTIMSYAGLCGAGQDLPGYNTMFHVVSFDQIAGFSRSGGGAICDVAIRTDNEPPTVAGGEDYMIPARTPFVLSGSAVDPDGDPLTYSWQQVDLGVVPASGTATLTEAMTDWGSGPIYRVYPPAADGAVRLFPSRAHVLTGTQALGEVYPTTTRALNFRLLARDNQQAHGGAAYDSVRVNVVDTGSTFAVIQPNSASVWPGGLARTVTWNVAGTNAAPVGCTAVDISLSTNGGASFPTLLAASTPNDGAEPVTLPATSAAAARIEVRCSSNIFYNISEAFVLSPPAAFGVLAGAVRDAQGAPVAWASVTASGPETVTLTTGFDGRYAVQLLTGTYALTVTAYGYSPGGAFDIAIGAGVTTTREITLAALPRRLVTGAVYDAGHGYGLHAMLTLTDAAAGLEVGSIWSDPITGAYSVTLFTGFPYSVSVAATLPGYTPVAGVLDPDDAGYALTPTASCMAPGYRFLGGQCAPVAGGLLAGGAYGPQLEPLAGVIVSGGGRSAISAATGDRRLPAAFYTLFLPPGSQPITATGANGGSVLPGLRTTTVITAGAVTWQDLSWQALYRDASLSSLQLSAGQLTPPFVAATTAYTAVVAGNVASVTLLPVTNVAGAAVRVNSLAVVSGVPSPPISLPVGATPIAVEVTSLDGSSRIVYSVTITRDAPAYSPLYLPDVRK